MRKKAVSLLLALALGMSLAVPALAADADWATGAVDELNQIYGKNVFSADDEKALTEGEVYTILTNIGTSTGTLTSDSTAPMTRNAVCALLAQIFRLPVDSGKTAIQYLYEQNIVNGKSVSDLGENDPITNAQLSVLIYRILNAAGGGKGFTNPDFKPGNEKAFAWTYLNVRSCVLSAYSVDLDTMVIGDNSATVTTFVPSVQNPDPAKEEDWTQENKSGEDLWEAWYTRLHLLIPTFTEKPAYNETESLSTAAVRMVNAADPNATSIFSNIPANHWAYDGVMYMFDRRIFLCMFDGSFGDMTFTRYQFAKILARLDNDPSDNIIGEQGLLECVQHAVEKDYMRGPAPENTNTLFTTSGWGHTDYLSREEMVMALLKQQQVRVADVNPAILDRFSDADQVSDDAKPYLAYAVSRNMILGTNGMLFPKVTGEESSKVSRFQVCIVVYRQLIGLDTTKMHDYAQNVQYALQSGASTGGGAGSD